MLGLGRPCMRSCMHCVPRHLTSELACTVNRQQIAHTALHAHAGMEAKYEQQSPQAFVLAASAETSSELCICDHRSMVSPQGGFFAFQGCLKLSNPCTQTVQQSACYEPTSYLAAYHGSPGLRILLRACHLASHLGMLQPPAACSSPIAATCAVGCAVCGRACKGPMPVTCQLQGCRASASRSLTCLEEQSKCTLASEWWCVKKLTDYSNLYLLVSQTWHG